MAGLDGSQESLAAAHWAAGEALRRGLPLRLVHAWEGLPENDTEASLPELRAPQCHARRVLRGAVDQISERYPQLHVAAGQVRRQPGPALLDEAENAELLVIGSQGLSSVVGFVAGSVAMATVAHAERPVVLVQPWRQKFPAVLVKENLHDPARVLVRAAGGAGLLVVGRRRRRAAVGSHTGPVAHALIHHVARPVALVPHD